MNSEVYEVERILDKRKIGRGYQYLIQWRGYEETSWEPKRNLIGCEELLDEYERRMNVVAPRVNDETITQANTSVEEEEGERVVEVVKNTSSSRMLYFIFWFVFSKIATFAVFYFDLKISADKFGSYFALVLLFFAILLLFNRITNTTKLTLVLNVLFALTRVILIVLVVAFVNTYKNEIVVETKRIFANLSIYGENRIKILNGSSIGALFSF